MNKRANLLILPGWLAVILTLGVWNLTHIPLQRDLSLFLPPTATLDERLLLLQLREGIAARTILIAIEGGPSSSGLAHASQALATALRDQGHFQRIANGAGDVAMDSREPLLDYRYLAGPRAACADALSRTGLHTALRARLGELSGPMPPLDKHLIAADPTACYRAWLRAWLPPFRPRLSEGVWMSTDGQRALLLAQPRADASDLPAQAAAVASIRATFAAIAPAEGRRLILSGPAVFAVESQESIRAQTVRLSIAASLLVALLLFAALRSAKLVLISALPLMTGLLAGIAVVGAIFGSLHGITLALGVTLLGVAMDYPIHILAHAERRSDGGRGLPGIGPTLLLAVVTSAMGYAALALAEFEGLAQLGVLSSIGLTTAALCARFLLPALLPPNYHWRQPAMAQWLAAALPIPSGRLRLLIALLAAMLLLAALAINPSPWTADLSRLSTVPPSRILLDQQLRKELGAPEVATLLFVTAATPDAALRRSEPALDALQHLVDANVIRGFESAARLLPSMEAQRRRQAQLPPHDHLQQWLIAANADLPFRPHAFSPFLDQIEASRALSPLGFEDLEGTPFGDRLRTLLHPFDDGWAAIIALMGADHPQAATALKRLAADRGLRYLDLRETSTRLVGRFIEETLRLYLITAVLIGAILMLALRQRARAMRVLIPILLSLTSVFALLLLIEGALNLFHLVSLLLVLGLSIDYSLFFSRSRTQDPQSARILYSLSICALSSFAMFALLAFSNIPVLRSIGLTVALGIAVTFPLTLLLSRTTADPHAGGGMPAAPD